MLKAIIMAGGSGTRFWPLSRQSLPKQFLRLHGERTLLQQAVDRIIDLVGADGVIVMTQATHVAQTRNQLPELPAENIIGEPMGRDTAPCIGVASEVLYRRDSQSKTIVLAADHLIHPKEAFHSAVKAAEHYLDRQPDALVTFGVKPTSPSTGYGYLRRGELVDTHDSVNTFRLQSFHEKPKLVDAERFVSSGEYCWNSGIFIWRTEGIRNEIARQAPKLFESIQKIGDAWGTSRQADVFHREFQAMEKKSIDYAVMENARHVAMTETPFHWDDVGSWLALERLQPADDSGNVVRGKHLGLRSKGCIIVGEEKHLVATLGVEDLIIVQTADVTLIARKSDEQAVKDLTNQLKERGLGEFA